MSVMSATFRALPGVQFIYAICRFEAQEVNNPMLQTMCDSEFKWRSYSHWKPITPSWRKNFARLRNHLFDAKPFCIVLWNSSWSFPIFATRWKPNIANWKLTSQRCEISLLLRSDFSVLFVCLRNIADLVFTYEMVLSASWYLRPKLLDIFLQIFVF